MRQRVGDIIIEYQVIGQVVKVSAVDTATLTEVSILGPAHESRKVLEATVIRKLRYVLEKKAKTKNDGNNGSGGFSA